MWYTEFSKTTHAKPETIHAIWADVQTWSRWDHALENSALAGEFAVGTTGTLLPKGAPHDFGFVLTEVSAHSFTDITHLPGADLIFIHTLQTTAEGTTLTHRAEIQGDAWEKYSTTIGKNIEHELPLAVENLIRLAELQ